MYLEYYPIYLILAELASSMPSVSAPYYLSDRNSYTFKSNAFLERLAI